MATKRNSAAARCQPPPGKRTLGGAIGERFRFVADTGLVVTLPLRLSAEPKEKP